MHVPDALKRGPFTLADARRLGLEGHHFRGKSWRRLGHGTYVWAGLVETPMQRLQAARLRLPEGAAFSGLTALWLHGLDVNPVDPVEVTIPKNVGVSGRAGIAVRQTPLPDVTTIRGMRVTSLLPALAEVCGRSQLTEGVVIADMALHARLLTLAQLETWAHSHPGRRGIKNLRRVVALAEPASASPMESRLRMVLILNGLPRPQAQVPIHDAWGRFVGRPDLYYVECRLGIEYDGGGHRETLADDNRRQNRLLNAGVRLLRFTASDVLGKPGSVAAQVRAEISTSPGKRTIRPSLRLPSPGKRTTQLKTIAS